MKEISIRGKTFSEEEICDYGKKRIEKTRKILLIIGISLIAIVFFMVAMSLVAILGGPVVDSETGEIINVTFSDVLSNTIFAVVSYGVPGVILIIISFSKAKSDVYEAGLKFLNKHFPEPVGFDGNVVEILQCDKMLELSKNPVTKLIISNERKFQLLQDKKYSKIYTGKDILDYEIKVDDEVVITSNTKDKKGVMKALVGGALFGAPGMIAGAIAGNRNVKTNQSQKEVHHYTLLLKVNDIIKPAFVVELESLQVAEEIVATLDIIYQENNPSVQEEEHCESILNIDGNKTDKYDSVGEIDKFQEIKKYKELLDMGIITKEEFEEKKKEIL